MELIMTIGDVITIPAIGDVIVGSNSEITKDDTSKLCKIGEDIVVIKDDKKLKFKVVDMKLSFSINEKVIISIKLEKTIEFNKLKIGDLVYKIE